MGSLGLSLLVTGLLLKRAGVGPAAALDHAAPAAHVLALVAFSLELLARGIRVAAVGQGLGLPVSLWMSVRAQLAGDALAAATPSRIGSDPAKIAVLRNGGVGTGAAGALLLAEMALEVVALAVAGLFIGVLVPGGWWIALGVGGYAAVVLLAGAVVLWASARPRASPPALWALLGLSAPRWGALRRAAAEFRSHAAKLVALPSRHRAAAAGATVLHILARLAVLPALVVPLVGWGGWEGARELILRPFFVLYATALLPPPGGGGGVEVVFATVLDGALEPGALAVTLVWWRIYTFYLSAGLGWLYLVVSAHRTHRVLDTHPSPEPVPTCSVSPDGP